MRNPLHKRFARQLRSEAGKYLGIFILLLATVSIVSGFLCVASSIVSISEGTDDANAVEDFRIESSEPLSDADIDAVASEGATLLRNFSRDVAMPVDGADATVRLYHNRDDVDTPSFYEGGLPQADDEVALDATFAAHHDLGVGDEVTLDGKTFSVCGIMVLPDYTTLLASNSDLVMDTITFSVGLVSSDGFERFDDVSTSYTYAGEFDDSNLGVAERTSRESDIAQLLGERGATITNLLDREQNQGIGYVQTDAQGDQRIYTIFLYLLIFVMGIVFAILTGSTIEQESSVIGTLMASGWRRGEIVRHYLFLPAFVSLVAIALGNVLGYSMLVEPFKDIYYNSYSLPPFHSQFYPKIFVMTSVIPFALLIAITLIGLERKLGLPPLAFLNHQVARHTSNERMRLPESLGYPTRFRLRILLRNVSSFAALFAGIATASLLTLFALNMTPTFQSYADSLADSLPTQHIYTLKAPYELEMSDSQQQLRDRLAGLAQLQETIESVGEAGAAPGDSAQTLAGGVGSHTAGVDELLAAARDSGLGGDVSAMADGLHAVADEGENAQTAVDQAEKVAIGSFEIDRKWDGGKETVTAYGIQENSRYWSDLDVSDGKVLVGEGLASKCNLSVGGYAVLYDKYADKNYALDVDDLCGSGTNTNIYMGIETFNELFGHDADWFNGYASDDELNIDADYLASTVTPDDMQKLANQIVDSMGSVVSFVIFAAMLIFVVVIYLLTKTVIDHSAQSISYLKVFGYRDREIDRLYLRTITLVVIASLAICLPLAMELESLLFQAAMIQYDGNMVVTFSSQVIATDLLLGLGAYAIAAIASMLRVRRIPLSLALKAHE